MPEKSQRRLKLDRASKQRSRSLICVLENPSNIVNVGCIIRTANALGINKVYVIDSKQVIPDAWGDIRGDKTLLGLSCGASRWTYVRKFQSTSACLSHLEDTRFVSAVTSPHQHGKINVLLHNGTFTQKRLAVWFGNETSGASQEVIDRAALCVQVEMFGMVESLNLANCASIVLWEVNRQRRITA